ncbi:MAG: hypothetical protein AB2L14_37465 [Candidatus Xenobiia bacterium LiM19]
MAAPKKVVKKETTAKKAEVSEHAEEHKAPEKVHEEAKVEETPAEKKEFKPKVY